MIGWKSPYGLLLCNVGSHSALSSWPKGFVDKAPDEVPDNVGLRMPYPFSSTCRVISAGQWKRSGTPQAPVPREV